MKSATIECNRRVTVDTIEAQAWHREPNYQPEALPTSAAIPNVANDYGSSE